MKENRIGGIPIVDNNKVLVGILTNRDLRFEDNKRRKVSEVMTTKDKRVAAIAERVRVIAEGAGALAAGGGGA